MIEEFQKSIKAVLYDRLTGPLSGAFFFSWLAWNWKLLFYVLSVDQTKNVIERIDYIQQNFISWLYNLWGPFFSAVFLVIVYPFFSVGAYNISLRFAKWKKNIKTKIENTILLSVEESVNLRTEISNLEEKYIILTKTKDDNISKLQEGFELYKKASEEKIQQKEKELKDLRKKIDNTNLEEALRNGQKINIVKQNWDKDYNNFLSSENRRHIDNLFGIIHRGSTPHSYNIPDNIVNYYNAMGLIKPADQKGYFEITDKGNDFLKRLNEK